MPATCARTGASHVSSPRRALRPQASHGLGWCLRWRPSANVPSLRSRRPQTQASSPPRRSTRSWSLGPPPRVRARRTSSTRAHSSSVTGGFARYGAGFSVRAHAAPHWRKPPITAETRPRAHSRRARSAGDRRHHMGYPTPVGRRALRRVARAAEHGGVDDVERRTASGERHDVIDGQVGGRVGGTLVARAPVAVLTAPGTEHAARPQP